jgi:hypothetical protein
MIWDTENRKREVSRSAAGDTEKTVTGFVALLRVF